MTFSISVLGPDFVLEDAGALCSDYSLPDVADVLQCKNSLPTVKAAYPNAIDGTTYENSWPDRPKGCFLHVGNMNVHWNSHQTGHRNNEDRSICIGKCKGFSMDYNKY